MTFQQSFNSLITRIENNFAELVNRINNISSSAGANNDLSNLSATGENHFQAPLVSGINIKTINSQTVIGGGNIAVQSPLIAGNNVTFTEGGQEWTSAYALTGFNNLEWWAVCHGEGKFLAVNIYGYISTIEDDGDTWSEPVQDSNLGQYNWWTYVTYGNGIYVAIGYEGQVSISTDDGDTWSEPEQLLGNHYWNGIAFDGTYFVAVSEQGYVSRCTNGLNWSTPTQIMGYNSWDSVAYGNGRYVALSPSGKVSISTDSGDTWSSAADVSALGNHGWYDLIYDGSKFVAISADGHISSSELGINWTQAEYISNLGNRFWTTITTNGSKLIALANSGFYSEVTTGTILSVPSEIFVAEYGTTTYQEVLDAYNSGKLIYCNYEIVAGYNNIFIISIVDNNNIYFYSTDATYSKYILRLGKSNNSWSISTVNLVNTDLSNISSTGKTVIDGQWVSLNQVIYSSQSLTSSTSADLPKTVNIPNDGQIYEVAFKAQVTTGSSSGNNIALNIKGNVLTDVYYVCSCQTRSNSSVQASGFVSIPLKYASDNLATLRSSSYSGTATLAAVAYRRIGSNT